MTRDEVLNEGDAPKDQPTSIDRAAEAINAARLRAADTMDSAANSMHARADNLPGTRKLAEVTHRAADKVGAGAQYLRDHRTGEMVDDLLQLIREHPGKSVLAALALGFMTARALRTK